VIPSTAVDHTQDCVLLDAELVREVFEVRVSRALSIILPYEPDCFLGQLSRGSFLPTESDLTAPSTVLRPLGLPPLSEHVLGVVLSSPQPEMVGIHTKANVARMKDEQVRRNLSTEDRPRCSVSAGLLPVKREDSISR
jgi:hypothetical protein